MKTGRDEPRRCCQVEKIKANIPRQLQKRSLGHRSATCRTNLLGKVVQQGVKAFEAALVDRHPDAPELAVAAFVKGDALGRSGCDHVRGAQAGVGRRLREG